MKNPITFEDIRWPVGTQRLTQVLTDLPVNFRTSAGYLPIEVQQHSRKQNYILKIPSDYTIEIEDPSSAFLSDNKLSFISELKGRSRHYTFHLVCSR